ncbi:MAG: nucleotide-binding protein [bacterium]|nr:nucleotide-binding protein [bacterium]
MKAKIFIGTSVEGLNVGYAIQQNLAHDAEATVWDQGVFTLSKTTIESLNHVVESMDFGIFVFSPDDVVVMKGINSQSVRDNVIFELGLFIGKLGRDRVFYVIPENSDIHIPTDLIGITPGKYDPNRNDQSLQAATGATCNQIRIQIKKLGNLKPEIESVQAAESKIEYESNPYDWIISFYEKKYTEAKEMLEMTLASKSGEERLINEAWLAYINFKIAPNDGVKFLEGMAEQYKNNSPILNLIFSFLTSDNYDDLLITFALKRLAESPSDTMTILTLSDSYVKVGEEDKAIALLNSNSPKDYPKIAEKLAEIHKNNQAIETAIQVLHCAYMNFPNNESLIFNYADLLQENNNDKESLYLFKTLTQLDGGNPTYWGNLGNVCLKLSLFDKGMNAYRRADQLTKGRGSWILFNIGNILKIKELYTDAILCFDKGLEIEPLSQYAHDRLSSAIKSQNEENEKLEALCKEGRKLLRNKSTVSINQEIQ